MKNNGGCLEAWIRDVHANWDEDGAMSGRKRLLLWSIPVLCMDRRCVSSAVAVLCTLQKAKTDNLAYEIAKLYL